MIVDGYNGWLCFKYLDQTPQFCPQRGPADIDISGKLRMINRFQICSLCIFLEFMEHKELEELLVKPFFK